MSLYSDYVARKNYGDNMYQAKQAAKEREERESLNKIQAMIEEARDKERFTEASYMDFKEQTLHEFLSTALNGIYMAALGETMIFSENTKAIASTLVDKYIKENGGAYEVLDKMRGKTYLLDTIREEVEEKAEETEEEVEADNPDTHEIPQKEEKKEDMLNKLEQEDDVEAAVGIIAQRISSAEEEFIKKNAEDKQKIEDLMNDMNERLQASKRDPNVSEEEQQETEQEEKEELQEEIARIHNDRPHTIFESFVENFTTSVVNKDSQGMKDLYFNESGKLDIGSIVEAAKCVYGFLEFLNTVQLESVDSAYLEEVINNL